MNDALEAALRNSKNRNYKEVENNFYTFRNEVESFIGKDYHNTALAKNFNILTKIREMNECLTELLITNSNDASQMNILIKEAMRNKN